MTHRGVISMSCPDYLLGRFRQCGLTLTGFFAGHDFLLDLPFATPITSLVAVLCSAAACNGGTAGECVTGRAYTCLTRRSGKGTGRAGGNVGLTGRTGRTGRILRVGTLLK